MPRRPGWTDNLLIFFLSGLQKLEVGRCSCFLPGRAKDLPAPRYWYRNAQLGMIRNESHPFPIFVIRFRNLMKCITSSITKRNPRAQEHSH